MRKVKLFSAALVIVFFFSNVSIMPGSRHFIKFGGEKVCGEGLDSYTKLLLHFNGADGSTAIADECGKTVIVRGNAKISTAQSKFGGTSVNFTGYDYIATPVNSDFNFGNGDFTIDFWFWANTISNDNSLISMGGKCGVYNGACVINLYNNKMKLVLTSGSGVGTDFCNKVGLITVTPRAWHHVAVVRSGSIFKLFLDGIEDTGLTTSSNAYIRDIPDLFTFGYEQGQEYNAYFNGYIDELRVSKGIARWTSNFSSPDMPYTTNRNPMICFFSPSQNGTLFQNFQMSKRSA
jgi:hypothetical protein